MLPELGTSVAERRASCSARGTGRCCGFIAWRFAAGQAVPGRTRDRAAGHVQQRRRGRRPLVRQEVRRLSELVVLRLLVHEPQAVVEREPLAHLPVVLDVELGVVVDRAGLDVLLRLLERAERADRRVGVAERRVERVRADRILLEADVAERVVARLLRLVAVGVVEAGLERVAAPRPSSG